MQSKVDMVKCRYKNKRKENEMKTRSEIIGIMFDLRCQIDLYREIRNFRKVAELRLEIERLHSVLRNMKEPVKVGG